MEREQVDTKNNPNPNTENKNNKKTLMIIGIILLIIMFIIFIIFITNKDKPSNTINGTENTQGTEQQSQTDNEDNKDTEQQPTEKEVTLLKEEYFHTILVASYEYNEYGELIKKIDYDLGEEQEINRTMSYEYDDRGNIVREVEDRGGYITEYQYVYDEQNRLIAKIEPKRDDLPSTVPTVKEEYIYDERGNKIECNIIYMYPGGIEGNKPVEEVDEYLWDGTNYTYNDENQLILKEEYSTRKYDLEEYTEYEYDKNGHCIKETVFDCVYEYKEELGGPGYAGAVPNFLYIHQYDEYDNLIYFESHSYSTNGNYCGKQTESYKYDSNKNLIEYNEYSYNGDDKLFNHEQTSYKYNEHNHVISEERIDKLIDSSLMIKEFKYTYNSDGSYTVYSDASGKQCVNNTTEEHYDKFGNLTYSKTVYSEGDGMFVRRGQTDIFEIKYETVTVKVRPTKEKE